MQALAWLGRHGRYCLIAGLLGGLLLPGLAEALRPWIGTLVAMLLTVTGMRIGARAAFGNLGELRPAVIRVILMQLALPLGALMLFSGLGLAETSLALAVTLMLAAPSLTGAPNFAIMAGHDPAPGMRLLVIGTALFPLTAWPVLYLLDLGSGGAWGALLLSLGLLGAILGATGIGFGLRAAFPKVASAQTQPVLDGLAALLLAIVVVGLMSAIGPLARSTPLVLVAWLAAVLLINAGLVLSTRAIGRRLQINAPIATAIYAGNRNIALFLIVLPEAVTAPLLIFIGCYQVPMYLTPFLLARLEKGPG